MAAYVWRMLQPTAFGVTTIAIECFSRAAARAKEMSVESVRNGPSDAAGASANAAPIIDGSGAG